MSTADGWIAHDGGPCPVDAETLVQLRFRTGSEWMIAESAYLYRWEHTGAHDDVVAYRLAQPEPAACEHDWVYSGHVRHCHNCKRQEDNTPARLARDMTIGEAYIFRRVLGLVKLGAPIDLAIKNASDEATNLLAALKENNDES